MKKLFENQWLKAAIFAALGSALCAACSSTTITETTYAADGKTVVSQKVTESSDSPLVIGIANTKDKHLVAHIGGWYGNIGVQPNSNSYGIGVGSLDNTYASIVAGDGKGGAEVAAIFPAIVDSSKYSLSITKDGASSEGGVKTSTTIKKSDNATDDPHSASETEGK